jgi:hypothetical protein
MTVGQMHISFTLGLDKVDSLAAPNFIINEIDSFLNESMEEFIEQRAWGTNMKKQGLEETQKRRDDLKDLIREVSITSTGAGSKPNSLIFELPQDYRHAISEECVLTHINCHGEDVLERVGVKPLSADRYSAIMRDPFNRPESIRVYKMDSENGSELISGPAATISEYLLRYIKQPAAIDLNAGVNCELADHTHREIVNMAVAHALGNIESQRIQLQMGENAQQE